MNQNDNYNSSLVNLTIPQNVTAPIVAAKIQEAVLAALGGQDSVIKGVINHICNTKVDKDGKVSSYSNDNNTNWMDYHVTALLQKSIKEELIKQITLGVDVIKDELIKQLQTKKGASKVAEALLSALNGTFGSSWMSKIDIQFSSTKPI